MSVKFLLTPRVNANDADAVVLHWLAQPLEKIVSGQPVCEIETTKATVEVAAEADGYLFPMAAIGDRVRVGQPLAQLLTAPDPSLAARSPESTDAGGPGPLISAAARELMLAHGLTDADFAGLPAVRRSDIERAIASRGSSAQPSAGLERIQGGDDAVVLYGAGRHGLVVLDTIRSSGTFRPVAFVDDHATGDVKGLPIFRAVQLADIAGRGVKLAHISMGDAKGVAAAILQIERAGLTLVSVTHPSAVVSPLATIGKGVFIGPLVIVGPDAQIGDLCFLNNASSAAHHCVLAPQVILADGARLGGNVRVGRRTLIGINATVNKDVKIGDDVTVVSGIAVFADVPSGTVVRADGKHHRRPV